MVVRFTYYCLHPGTPMAFLVPERFTLVLTGTINGDPLWHAERRW